MTDKSVALFEEEFNENIISFAEFSEKKDAAISETSLFTDVEKKDLMEASPSMMKAFKNSQVFRTETEARVSVLNDIKFPTIASKYYQSLRELNVHQCEMVGLLYDYKEKQLDLKKIELDLDDLERKKGGLIHQSTIYKSDYEYNHGKNWEENDLNRGGDGLTEWDIKVKKVDIKIARKTIELNRTKFQLQQMRRTAEGRHAEIMQWHKVMGELEPKLLENNIPIDDVNFHQAISYAVRFIKQTITNIVTANSSSSTSEINNLKGQLVTTIRKIEEDGVMNALLEHLVADEKVFLMRSNIITDDSKQLIASHGDVQRLLEMVKHREELVQREKESVEQPQIQTKTENYSID